MGYLFPADVRRLVETRMAAGGYATEDDLLRDALEALSAEAEELEAIEVAVREWEAGEPFIPLAKAFDDVRGQSQAPNDA